MYVLARPQLKLSYKLTTYYFKHVIKLQEKVGAILKISQFVVKWTLMIWLDVMQVINLTTNKLTFSVKF